MVFFFVCLFVFFFPEKDEPPLSKAGQDVVLHLPTDGVILDGRESTDDRAIVQYEWTLLQGDPSVDMKVIPIIIVTKTNVSVKRSSVISFHLYSPNV